jgi:hypothetical protein
LKFIREMLLPQGDDFFFGHSGVSVPWNWPLRRKGAYPASAYEFWR